MTGEELSYQIILETLKECKYQGLLRQLRISVLPRYQLYGYLSIEIIAEKSRIEDCRKDNWHFQSTNIATQWHPFMLFVRMFGRRYVMFELRVMLEKVLRHELKEALIYQGKYWDNPHPEIEEYKRNSH